MTTDFMDGLVGGMYLFGQDFNTHMAPLLELTCLQTTLKHLLTLSNHTHCLVCMHQREKRREWGT